MKVRCVRFIDWRGSPVPQMSGITEGGTYAVVSLSAGQTGVNLRVVTDDGNLAMYPVQCFEIVDPALPTTWTAFATGDGYVQLAPEEWHPGGRFMDEDADAYEPLGASAQDVRALVDQVEELRSEADPDGNTPIVDMPTLPDVYDLERALKPAFEAFAMAVRARRPDVTFTLSQRPTIHYWSSSLMNFTWPQSEGDLVVAGAVLDLRADRPTWSFDVVTGEGLPIAESAFTPTWRQLAEPSWSAAQLGAFLTANLEAVIAALPHVTLPHAD